MATNPENELIDRVSAQLKDQVGAFDPTIIVTLIDMLTGLFANCTNTQLTPQQAVDRVKNMSLFEQSMLKSRLKKQARDAGVKDADNLAGEAIKAVKTVAVNATPEDQLALASYLLPIANLDFEMI